MTEGTKHIMSYTVIFLIINKHRKHQGKRCPEPLPVTSPIPGVPDGILRRRPATSNGVMPHSLLWRPASALILHVMDKDEPRAG